MAPFSAGREGNDEYAEIFYLECLAQELKYHILVELVDLISS